MTTHSPLSPMQMKIFLVTILSLRERYSYSLNDYDSVILLSFAISLSESMEKHPDGPITISLYSDLNPVNMGLQESERIVAHHVDGYTRSGGRDISYLGSLQRTLRNILRGILPRSGQRGATQVFRDDLQSLLECPSDQESGSE